MPGKKRRGRVKKIKPTIYHAAREGLVADLELFLQQGADINEPDNLVTSAFPGSFAIAHWSPLHYSCLLGRKDAVKCLVEHGADVNKLTEGVSLPFILFLFPLSCLSFIYMERVLFPLLESLYLFLGVFLLFNNQGRTKETGTAICPFCFHRWVSLH
jgi:hypothetical protein